MSKRRTLGRHAPAICKYRRPWPLTALCLCLAAAPASAGNLLGDRPVRSLLEIRYQNVVPQKWDISCGAAALATVLNYQHHDTVTEKEVAKAMLKGNDPARVRARLGFSLLDLKRFADSRGYRGIGYRDLGIEDLVKFGPTIVPIRVHGYNHFVIFRGLEDGRVLLADPAFGNRRMPLDQFKSAWLQNLGFVVVRRDGLAVPTQLHAQPADFTDLPGAALRAALR
ncbi:MAG: C39 family peptidase [Pseudomonadota bacterium]